MKANHDIMESISCLDDEDLVEKAYGGLLATTDLIQSKNKKIIINTHNGGRRKDFNTFLPVVKGIYIPGSPRYYWTGYVDPVDFPLPETGCVYITPQFKDVEFEFISIKRINSIPEKTYCKCKNQAYYYKAFHTLIYKSINEKPFVNESHYVISKTGDIYSVVDKLKLRESGDTEYSYFSLKWDEIDANHYFGGAISLLADRRYLWNIRTKEETHLGAQAIVNFGVEQDMVKSLVFARDNPLTATGRKRPILHWVKSHKRRIKENIKINIKKHLRGITEFKMGELLFTITKPVKNIKV